MSGPADRLARFFTPADLAAIEAAVREVEARTAGELVPYAVGQSDAYARAAWTAATLGALGGGLVAALVHTLGHEWGLDPALWMALPPASGAALGWLAVVAVPGLRRALVPAEVLDHRVRQRATAAFVAEEVFRTRDRTGILLFLSVFERRVLVLADVGIAARVAQREWDEIATAIAAGIRRGAPGPALAAGIRRCGELLATRVPVAPADRDELPDQLRTDPS